MIIESRSFENWLELLRGGMPIYKFWKIISDYHLRSPAFQAFASMIHSLMVDNSGHFRFKTGCTVSSTWTVGRSSNWSGLVYTVHK